MTNDTRDRTLKTTTAIAGTFNAFAFAGAGWIFSKLNHSGYQAEMKRHNKAMEQLTKDRDTWNEQRLHELDRLAKLHYDKDQANKDISSTNKDFLLVKTKFENTKPQLSSYYKPSQTMEEYMSFVKLAATVPVLYAVVALL